MKTIKMLIPALIALGLSFTVAGCVLHGTARVHGQAQVEPPELVYVSPGVQVVYDYHEPVFYTDGFYWRYHSGVWYRSSYHSHGWVRYPRVPRTIARIDRPQGYVRYRGNARGHSRVRSSPPPRHSPPARHSPPPRHSPARPEVRDHRGAPPPHARPAPAPAGRGGATVRGNARGTVKPAPARAPDKRDDKDKDKVRTRDHRR
jgi:hypothetical protein